MFELETPQTDSKPELYETLAEQLEALLGDERNWIANLANTAALLFHTLPELNWAGFYLMDDRELVVGPFQGKPACVRIAVGRGVCGVAAERRTSVLVEDVDAFPGHIACDAASRSEVVVPLVAGGRLLGVMDLDSASVGRFDGEDAAGLEALAAILLRSSDVDGR